jgi:hypothetical protein
MKQGFLICCAILLYAGLSAQQRIRYTRLFQLSLIPGISTNGMHPGGYHNYFSLNLTAGYSASNYLLEFGIFSNLNTEETRGLQLAGLGNLTGANAFSGMQSQEREEKSNGGFEVNLSGVQISGLANVVLNNVFGWQATGGVNIAKGAMQGFQVAGVANLVYKYSFGVQLAGLWNISYTSMDGLQVSSLANYTEGGLFGTQIGIFNQAGFIEGKNSFENDDPTGLQLGLVNRSGKMNGFQIGLLNMSSSMQGTQVGLVNIYRGGKQADTRDGTSMGLLNFGNSAYVALYGNELFFTNLEVATGTFKNGRVMSDKRNIYIQNALIYANNPSFLDKNGRKWSFGYGLKKFYFTRSTAPTMNDFRFLSLGVDAMHINYQQKELTRSLSLLIRPNVSFGTRLYPKLRSIYIFAALTYNVYFYDEENEIAPSFLETSTSLGDRRIDMWPGSSAGIHVQ